jgi:phenol hydroxylase P0 protein
MMKTLTRYVHVTSRDRPGLVEFNFSIDDPTLYLEMILPVLAFEDFCRSNQVTFLTDEQAEAVAKQQEKWRYGEDDNVYMTDDN